ncbi:AAA family ATPase [Macrococcoides caseolyticum]|uniref:AAA family ATPase n=1 Tax=Macrococcoides caseolyticum TaxID=69966 RepID=UPI001F47777A|nr:SMC family ATPase [Macrococcus caseolyticus]MCE4957153.1 SMC family ATPase [Macrococcus caseolyticus]
MRPNYLQLKAFGPFKNETIHFNHLKNHKLFLISGKTGAGKTTIFDGMMYALFGKASTSDRGESNLRNIFASDDEPTEVKFSFFMQHKQYEIHRNVPYKKSGNTSKTKSQLSVYEIINGEKHLLASTVTTGEKVIMDIVKLNAAQFRKIFILPQGEFKSLLVSGSKEKSDILRSLFDTTKIQQLSILLRDNVSNAQQLIQQLEAELGVQFSLFENLVTVPSELSYQEKHLRIQSALIELYETINLIKEEHAQSRERLQVYAVELKTAQQLKENIENLKRVNAQLQEVKNSEASIKLKEQDLKFLIQLEHYQVTKGDLSHQQEKKLEQQGLLKSLEEQLLTSQTEISNKKKSIKDLSHNQIKMQEYKKFVIKNERYLDNFYKNLSKAITQNTSNILQLENEIKVLQQNLGDIKSLEEQQLKLKHKQLENDSQVNSTHGIIEKLRIQQSNVNKTLLHLEKILRHQKECYALEEKIITEKNALKSLNSSEQVQDIEAIESIKSTLSEGDRCPVCSNIVKRLDNQTHIKAHRHQTNLQAYQKLYDEHYTALNIYISGIETIPEMKERIHFSNDFIVQCEKINAQINAAKYDPLKIELILNIAKFTEHYQALIDDNIKHYQNEIEKYNLDNNALDKQLEKTHEAIQRMHDVSQELEKKKNDLNQLILQNDMHKASEKQFLDETGAINYQQFEHQWYEYKSAYEAYETNLLNAEKQLEQHVRKNISLKENITNVSNQLKEIDIQINKLEERISQYRIPEDILVRYRSADIPQLIGQYEIEIKAFNERMTTLSHEQNRLTELINDKSMPDMEEMNRTHHELMNLVDRLHTKLSTLQEQYKRYSEHMTKLESMLSNYESQSSDIRSLVLLSDVLNGHHTKKIDLESYVLMYYLEQTLIRANIRLKQMTSNRYELCRKNEKEGGGKQGLIIEVFDYNANQTRNISSLSGGETFLASLCLALGLSDFVMQISGGIHLEAVFIDEGFGTLDNDTLEVAINALIELQTSGKLVGMISHVQLLKERIPAILKVTTDGFNSTAAFEIK